MCVVILLLIVLLKKLRQPYPIAYIVAGFLLGPQAGQVFTGADNITSLGEIGVLLLMFFLGMEIEVPDNRSLLLQPLIAQGTKMLLSIACIWVAGLILHWRPGNMLILAILLIFNSTAVVSEFLRSNNELNTMIGKVVLNILLLQDIMLAPAFTFFRIMGKEPIQTVPFIASIAGCILLFLLLRAVRNRNLFQLPVWRDLERDHDLQVFTGAFICIGFALVATYMGLSGPVGSFAAGIYLGRTRVFHWLGQVLRPFKVFFVALFFLSIGLMLDLRYIREHYLLIGGVSILVLFINSILSAAVFRLLHYSLADSFYAGALLSQTGELGLLACSIAYKAGIINEGFFKAALAITGLSLLLSTAWISVLRRFIYAWKFSKPIKVSI